MTKQVSIIGENYYGHWDKSRTACRAIVIHEGKLLLSYETKTCQYMIPGGGLEAGEEEVSCCIRETSEETGFLVQPGECFLEIDEYYEDWKYISRYYRCELTGRTTPCLTAREKAVGMEPRWMPVDEIREIFAGHQAYAATDEMRRGLYLREYTALCTLQDE